MAGEPGEPGCGLHAGENPGDMPDSLCTDGEKAAPPGVMPLPIAGDHAPYPACGLPSAHGVIPGVMEAEGEAADPKNMPPAPATPAAAPPIMPSPMFIGISIPYLHFSVSSRRSKEAVPILGNCPMMMFSETPLIGSTSACDAASMRTSTVSSKEHLIRAPLSCLLIPCLVMAMR